VRQTSAAWCFAVAFATVGCDQLGNPPQYATPPTPWKDANGHLVTTSRSFKNANTIRRLVSEGIQDFDYADPAIGPSQTLTIVVVVPRAIRPTPRPRVRLVTRFELENRTAITRKWTAPPRQDRWNAAFALPEPPTKVVTAVVP
jgi:hypothetical protein